MRKKAISIALALSMMTSCVSLGSVAASAATVSGDTVAAASDYNLPARIEDGNILHCFNWKYNDIKAELKNIAEAGFTAVQTSPAQNPKETGQWYWLYQPRGFNIASSGPLGTKAELKSLCTAADQYGIKVIVDVVANHLNDDNNTIEDGMSASQYWHSNLTITNYEDRNQVINGRVGMRDLNTSNTTLQNKVKSYVADLKAQGVDCIRWDAAKHIGLPSEGETFWTNVLDQTMYNYGEIYDKPGGNYGTVMSGYTALMGVTDHPYSGEIMGHVRDNDVYDPAGYWTEDYDIPAEKVVLFAENHDSFANDTNDGGWTKNLTQNQVDRAYAIVAARATSQALYLSRPSSTDKQSIYAGTKGSTHFTSSEVAAVNAFHNAMVGTNEAYYTADGCTVVSREGGAVVVSPKSSNVTVTVPNEDGMVPAGSYVDKVSGTQWTVTASEMTGTIGDKGIAVFYTDPTAKPTVSVNPGSKSYTTDTLTVTLALNNATSGSYSLDGGAYQSFTGTQTLTIGSGKEYGTVTTLAVKATNGTDTSDVATYTYTKTEPAPVQTIYFDNSSYNWSNVYCYLYTDGGGQNGAWPGTAMTKDGNMYTLEVPAGFETSKVIFTESETATTNRYPANQEPGLVMNGDSMLFSANHTWEVYGTTPTQPVTTQPVTTQPVTTQPVTTQPVTTTPVTQPTTMPVPSGRVLIGDADGNGNITIKDATVIQAHLAQFQQLSGNALLAADVDQDGKVTVKDVTAIQRYLVNLSGSECHAGEYIGGEPETQPETQPTTAPADGYVYYKNSGSWSAVYAHIWQDMGATLTEWPGNPMENIGNDVWRIAVPDGYNKIIFNDGKPDNAAQTDDLDIPGSGMIYENDTWSAYTGGDTPVTQPTQPTDPTDPPIPSDTRTILFTDNKGWGSVNVHYWGGSSETEWPGIAMTPAGNNELGEPQFSAEIPTDTTGMVFNGPSGQTVDVTYDNTTTGWYPLDTTDGEGHYEVGSWTSGDDPVTDPTDPPVPSDTITILFTDNKNWGSVNVHYWGGSSETAWPGVAMTPAGTNGYNEPQYSAEIPADTTGLVFNSAAGQTVDIAYDGYATGFYLLDSTDGQGHYEVGSFGGPSVIEPTDSVKIYFTNNNNWSSVYAYAWDADGNELFGAWPGTAMTDEGDNGYGNPQCSVMVPTTAAYIIFTDGVNQTVDIPFDATVSGYYLSGTTDNDNHYEVESWTEDSGQGGSGQGGTDVSGTSTVLFTNNKGWGAVSCYVWDDNETKLLGDWPGTAMTSLGTNGYGEEQYSIEVPNAATGIIFTDGSSQTVDIPFSGGSIGYYLTDQTDGKWNVGTWVPES